MSLTRFRLRTIMIVIAALAIVLGAIRFAPDLLGVDEVYFRLEGWNVWVYLDVVADEHSVQGGPSGVVIGGRVTQVLMIPMTSVLVLTGVPVGILAVALYWRSLLGRRAILRRNSVDVENAAGRFPGRPSSNQSGGPEGG